MQKCLAAVIIRPAGCVFARGKSSGVSGSDENRQKLFCNGYNSGTVRSADELWKKSVLNSAAESAIHHPPPQVGVCSPAGLIKVGRQLKHQRGSKGCPAFNLA
jgi:hypothetical protein